MFITGQHFQNPEPLDFSTVSGCIGRAGQLEQVEAGIQDVGVGLAQVQFGTEATSISASYLRWIQVEALIRVWVFGSDNEGVLDVFARADFWEQAYTEGSSCTFIHATRAHGKPCSIELRTISNMRKRKRQLTSAEEENRRNKAFDYFGHHRSTFNPEAL